MRNLTTWLAGADDEVLTGYPGERSKFVTLGAVMIVTGVMASVSMWFFLYMALHANGAVAIPFALGWGVGIICVDRMLVVSMHGQRDSRGSTVTLVAARLILALLLGAVISTPLTIRIFAPEINKQISVIHRNQLAAFLQQLPDSAIGKQITTLKKELSAPTSASQNTVLAGAEATLAKDQKQERADLAAWQCQLYGGPQCKGSPKGDGPVAQADYQAYQNDKRAVEQEQAEIKTATSASLSADQALEKANSEDRSQESAQLKTATDDENQEIASFTTSNAHNTGLLISLQALDQVTAGNPVLQTARWLLFLLLATFEILPVLTKILQNRGPSAYEHGMQEAVSARMKANQEAWRNAHNRMVAELTDAKVRSVRETSRPTGKPKSASPAGGRSASRRTAARRFVPKRSQTGSPPRLSSHPVPGVSGKILREYRPGPGPAASGSNGQNPATGRPNGSGAP